ncbi:hypothetical protein CDV31_005944 [Fusarium ambrosium]|uniref:Protein kinase domain-containing protein n=1 Tax=Fusarium ambrosium TaxID=131363 RepID=A0A428UG26_9HYPO|nr:hypothetical protein CDV31_005944 [Fusarium ambrosium]
MEVLKNSCRGDLLARIHDTNTPVKKIFLILGLAEMLDVAEKFISGQFSDHHLPITTSELDDRRVAKSRQGDELFQNSNLDHSELGWFKVQQRKFLSPVFENKFEFHLLPRIPLPLIEKDKGTRSGFSVVYKVKVHPAHIPRGLVGDLAMKELSLKDEEDAECLKREMKNLESLRELDHLHLIESVAVCVRGELAFFFFPWAEKGDLYKFWERTDPESYKDIVVPWMLGQMVGLSSALELLADKNCRHSDLKPQNILLFPGGDSIGTLKITDVGISKFHILATTRRLKPTSAKDVTMRYCPPEFDESKPGKVKDNLEGSREQKLSRRFDIWSLGCVFIEFLIWAKLGQNEYLIFDEAMGGSQKFWDRKSLTPADGSDSESSDTSEYHYSLRRRVQKRLKQLKCLKPTPDDMAIGDVLKLIEKDMLVFDYRGRLAASGVHSRLKEIQNRRQQLSSTDNTTTRGVDIDVVQSFGSSEGLTTTAVPRDNAAAQIYVSGNNGL